MQYVADHANELGIPQVQTPDGPKTVWLMDRRQFLQLRNDKEWKDSFLFAGPRDKTNPLFSGATAEILGNIIFVASAAFGIQHSGNSVVTTTPTNGLTMPAYGPTNLWIAENASISGLDNNSLKIAWLLGEHALDKIYGRERFVFTEEKGDAGRRHEMIMEAYCSYCRADQFDTNNEYGNGANAFYQHTGSVGLITWSPKAQMI
jgi:hypothetical protein